MTKPLCYSITTSHPCWGKETGLSLVSKKKGIPFQLGNHDCHRIRSGQALSWAFLPVNHSLFLYTFVVTVVDVTVRFLIVLISRCHFCHLFLQFSSPSTHRGGRSGGKVEQASCGLGSLNGELNWGVPVLNHKSHIYVKLAFYLQEYYIFFINK